MKCNCCDSFRWTAKGLSHTYTCIYSPANSPPIQAATSHWAEFPALHSRSLLVIHFKHCSAICYQKRCMAGPAAGHSKVNKQARLVERKVRFISDAGNWGSAREQTSVQRQLATRGARDFIDWRRGLHVDPAQSALLVIFKFILDGLTSVISIVLGTVSLQFQGPFVPISLRSILELWQLVSWVQSGHHAVSFLPLGPVIKFLKQLRNMYQILSLWLYCHNN